MADRPILFSAPMVRALIAGTKTQTRRILKPQPFTPTPDNPAYLTADKSYVAMPNVGGGLILPASSIRISAGDRLYVREAWRVSQKWDETPPRDLPPRTMTIFCEAGGSIANQANGRWEPDNDYPPFRPDWVGKFRQAMHMPRWASRITLIVEDVKIERLQDISEADAIAEGIYEWEGAGRYGLPELGASFATAIRAYRDLWGRINGPNSWDENPWVGAYTFRRIMGNIDQIEGITT